MSRLDEIGANLAAVRLRLASACLAAGRNPEEVLLIAVTKTWPIADVEAAASLGLRDVGESRDQEAAPKAAARPDLVWHFVGAIQSNKARSIGSYSNVVHSLDRADLVDPIARGAREAGRTVRVLVQARLDGEPGRRGADRDEVLRLAELIEQTEGLRCGGVMGIAPLGEDPNATFGVLSEIAAAVVSTHPEARDISAGMSGDLESAIANGSTMVRVGSAIFGAREPRLR